MLPCNCWSSYIISTRFACLLFQRPTYRRRQTYLPDEATFYLQGGRPAVHQRLEQNAKGNAPLVPVDRRPPKRRHTLVEHETHTQRPDGRWVKGDHLPGPIKSDSIGNAVYLKSPISHLPSGLQAFLSRQDSKFGLFLSSDETGKFTSEPYSPPLW